MSSYRLSLKSLNSLLTSPPAFFFCFFFCTSHVCGSGQRPLILSFLSGIVMSHSAVSLSTKRCLTFLQTLQTPLFHPSIHPPAASSSLSPSPRPPLLASHSKATSDFASSHCHWLRAVEGSAPIRRCPRSRRNCCFFLWRTPGC